MWFDKFNHNVSKIYCMSIYSVLSCLKQTHRHLSLHQHKNTYKYYYSLTIQESNTLKHDTTLQIRINKMRKQLIQEQLGETSISDFIRTSLNNLLIQEHTNTHSWKVDEYNKRRI